MIASQKKHGVTPPGQETPPGAAQQLTPSGAAQEGSN